MGQEVGGSCGGGVAQDTVVEGEGCTNPERSSRLLGVFQPSVGRVSAACWACFSRLLLGVLAAACCWAAVGVRRGSGAAWRCFRGRLGCSAGMEGCGSERGKKRKRKKEEK